MAIVRLDDKTGLCCYKFKRELRDRLLGWASGPTLSSSKLAERFSAFTPEWCLCTWDVSIVPGRPADWSILVLSRITSFTSALSSYPSLGQSNSGTAPWITDPVFFASYSTVVANISPPKKKILDSSASKLEKRQKHMLGEGVVGSLCS